MNALPEHLESIHPALWRATQLARAYERTVDTGIQHCRRNCQAQAGPSEQ